MGLLWICDIREPLHWHLQALKAHIHMEYVSVIIPCCIDFLSKYLIAGEAIPPCPKFTLKTQCRDKQLLRSVVSVPVEE